MLNGLGKKAAIAANVLFFQVFSVQLYADILQGSATLSAGNNITVAIEINTYTDRVQITWTGPSNVYMGLGFGATKMKDTYAFVANANGIPFHLKKENLLIIKQVHS